MLLKLVNLVKGHKTYIISAVAVILNFAVFMKWVSVDQLNTINTILGGLGLSALRAGIAKSVK